MVSRSVLFAGTALAIAAAAPACSLSMPVYGGPGVDVPLEDASARDGRAPPVTTTTPPGSPDAAACFSSLGDKVKGSDPVAHRNLCDAQAIGEVERTCLTAVHGDVACKAWKDAHQECARCIFGPLDGEAAGSAPIGALIPSGPQSLMPNLGSCGALVLGRADCALPIAKASACTAGSCTACIGTVAKRDCEAFAETACVGTKERECDKALKDDFSVWASTCQGANLPATFTRVAYYLCGAPPLDAGTD